MKATLESARVFVSKVSGSAVLEVKYVLENGTNGIRITKNPEVLMAMLAKEVDVEPLPDDLHTYQLVNFTELTP